MLECRGRMDAQERPVNISLKAYLFNAIALPRGVSLLYPAFTFWLDLLFFIFKGGSLPCRFNPIALRRDR